MDFVLAAGALQFLEDFHTNNPLFQKKVQATIDSLLSISQTIEDKKTTLMSTAKGDVVVTESGLGNMGTGDAGNNRGDVSMSVINSPSRNIMTGASTALSVRGGGQSPFAAMKGGLALNTSTVGAGAAGPADTSLFAGHGVRL